MNIISKLSRKIMVCMALLTTIQIATADNYTTSGEGTSWTLPKLAEHGGTNVCKGAMEGVWFITDSLTIAPGDQLTLTPDVHQLILSGEGTRLIILGGITMQAEQATEVIYDNLADGNTGNEGGSEIVIDNEGVINVFQNIKFNHIGIKALGRSCLNITDCSFTGYDGDDAGVVYMANHMGELHIKGSTFKNNQRPAIANSYGSATTVDMTDCYLEANALNNKNTPQINLVAAPTINISRCHIIGDPELTMVGGIGIANWTSEAGLKAILEDNTIEGCRYGLTTMGPMDVRISGNQLIGNDRETNANNGGSGISIYDPYYKTRARISGNHIEGNLWGVTIIGGGDINLGRIVSDGTELAVDDPDFCAGGNTFLNNGNNGQLYDLYNNGTQKVYAQNNTWGVTYQTEEAIEEVITHSHDNPALGEVIFLPTTRTADAVELKSTPGNHTERTDDRLGVYDLQGRQVGNNTTPLPHGIYIVKGKKVKR